MSCICRTCLSEITSNRYVDINLSEFTREQLKLCIPELNLDLVMEPVLCLKCVEALSAAHDFKSCCLKTEQRIHTYVETLTIEQQHVELDAVLGNNCNGINSMAMHCGNDVINDLNIVHGHSRTRHDLEDYKDAKGECSVTSENCSETLVDDGLEVNYDSFKEESIKIEEHEWDSFIKSEMFDTGKDAEDVKMELDTKSNVTAMQSELNYALAAVIGTAADNIFLPEPSRSDDCEEHNESTRKNSSKSLGLLGQCNKLDPVNYNANNENFNSATSAEFSTKQDNSVTKSQVGVVSMEPNNSSASVRLLRQHKVNSTTIGDTSNIHSINWRFKSVSSIKSHSTTSNLCKRANRRVRYRCRQKEKNIEEQIVAKSEMDSELLRERKMVLTRMDISSAEEILNVDNYPVMKGVGTQVKKSSLRCDRNIKSNHTAATEAEVDVNSLIDRSQLHLKHSNTSALNNSNTYTNVSLQHFINSNNLSVKNQELSTSSHLLNTIGKNVFKCDQCDYACSQKNSLKLHIRNHSHEKPYKCNVCNYAYSQKSYLITHVRNHIGDKPYKCDQCDYASPNKSRLNDHSRTHTGEKPYKCDQCNFACSKKCNLIVHVRNHTGAKPYKCDQCDYASPNKSRLNDHLCTHIGEKPYKCDQCDYASSNKSHLNNHLWTHTGEKPYKCGQCNYACSRKDNLIVHIRNHTGDKPYKCDQCDYASPTKSRLNDHSRTHTGEKPYKCDQCDFACSKKCNLIIHIRNHTGAKPYKCDQCDYASPKKSRLNDHLSTHIEEKPYKCDQCNYACSRKDNLIIHIKNHTGDKPYKCDQCDYASPTKSRLNDHSRTHTGEKPYKCDQCDFACSKKCNLIIHIRNHTGAKPYKCDQCDYASPNKSRLNDHLSKHIGEKPCKCDQCDFVCAQSSQLIRHMKKHLGEKPY